MLFENERSRRAIDEMARRLAALLPGECFEVSADELAYIQPKHYNGATWNKADRVMESVIGSCYGHYYFHDQSLDRYTFGRHREGFLTSETLSYVDPDRRHRYVVDMNGLFRIK